jgi:hypothetical protein
MPKRCAALAETVFHTFTDARALGNVWPRRLAVPSIGGQRPTAISNLNFCGFTVEQIFPNLEELGMIPKGRPLQ